MYSCILDCLVVTHLMKQISTEMRIHSKPSSKSPTHPPPPPLTCALSELRARQRGQMRDGAALGRIVHVVPVVVVGRAWRARAGGLGIGGVIERRPVPTGQRAELGCLALRRHRVVLGAVARAVTQR